MSKAEIDGRKIGWEDLNSLHFGAEYIADLGSLILPLRGGFYTNPTIGLDDNEDQIKGIVFTAGGGLVFESITFDLGMELGAFSEYEIIDGFEVFTVSQGTFRLTMGAVVHLGDLMN